MKLSGLLFSRQSGRVPFSSFAEKYEKFDDKRIQDRVKTVSSIVMAVAAMVGAVGVTQWAASQFTRTSVDLSKLTAEFGAFKETTRVVKDAEKERLEAQIASLHARIDAFEKVYEAQKEKQQLESKVMVLESETRKGK
jgi:hypothetical protein